MMDETMLKKEVLQELMDFMDDRVADKIAKKKMGAMGEEGVEAEPIASKMAIEVEATPEGKEGFAEKLKQAMVADSEEEVDDDDDDDIEEGFGLPARFKKMRA